MVIDNVPFYDARRILYDYHKECSCHRSQIPFKFWKDVLKFRILGGLTLQETADRIGRSRARVRQIESKIFRILRKHHEKETRQTLYIFQKVCRQLMFNDKRFNFFLHSQC